MSATIQGDGQFSPSVTKRGIVIRLPLQVFGKAWSNLMASLLEATDQRRFIAFTPRVMTERDPGPDAPRWKGSCVDVLSWMIFLLKVPLCHELMRLWHVIDWDAINRIAAPLYQNAHGGRLAWAPAQLIAMLMFLYNVSQVRHCLPRRCDKIEGGF
ncbi:MAG: hypothetical protein V3S14_11040 [Anaerolineae bacterium]